MLKTAFKSIINFDTLASSSLIIIIITKTWYMLQKSMVYLLAVLYLVEEHGVSIGSGEPSRVAWCIYGSAVPG